MRRILIAGAVVALSACNAKEYRADREERAEAREESIDDDVELLSCHADEMGYLAAQIRVTNNSSERSNYLVQVAFSSAGGSEQLETATAMVNALNPGQSATEEPSAFEKAPAYECEVVDVTRYSDE